MQTTSPISKATGGQIMHQVNQNSFSKSEPCVKMIKASVDQAVRELYGDQAHFQLQGSVGKGTGIAGVSDLDFFVTLGAAIDSVTKAKRKKLMERVMELNECTHEGRLGEHRIQLLPVLDQNLPSIDIVFERFKAGVKIREEPNANLSESHEAQIVTKFLKALPFPTPGSLPLLGGYTNLSRPKHEVERFVMLVEQELSSTGHCKKDLTGARGVALLQQTCLEKIARLQKQTPNHNTSLVDAKMMADDQWAHAAKRCLNTANPPKAPNPPKKSKA